MNLDGLVGQIQQPRNLFLHEPFFVDSLNRAALVENRSIKTDSETFLCHFIGNVNYLAWPDPRPPIEIYDDKFWMDETASR